MYITSKKLALILNIKLKYLFKIMSDSGVKQLDIYHVSHLYSLSVFLESGSYKRQVLRLKLIDIIGILESDPCNKEFTCQID